MSEIEFRETVIKMRKHQDAFFRDHQRSDLIEARRLEIAIDAENERWKKERQALRAEQARIASMQLDVPEIDA